MASPIEMEIIPVVMFVHNKYLGEYNLLIHNLIFGLILAKTKFILQTNNKQTHRNQLTQGYFNTHEQKYFYFYQ